MSEKRNIAFFTNDVETTSIVNGGLRTETGVKVWKEGMPRLLDLYAKYNVKSTFFFVADFAKDAPEIVKMIQPFGHEVACHGLTHDHKQAFDLMNFDEQKHHLREAKKILEDISGEEVLTFRAPALRVNEFTAKALIEAGFKIDSSVAPQRIDMFMSLGSKKKLAWLKAPRVPYYVSENNLARKGNTQLLEVPVSSFAFPYIGTFMRISPQLNKMTRHFLYQETKNTLKPINFLIHPNELIEEDSLHLKTEKRASNFISYLLSDLLRKKLKQRNLGISAQNLFEEEIKFWERKNYNFTTIKKAYL
ncbi:Polysaccharide deacetylase domain protein [uncultured Paludibacter sp.]|uniref:Polysaccharide deacetylase domain protein n=1 Tax=uncultured Paludibacter sp. TaxID=497635 RepID=A0A653A9I2_9BACT|nr:Polysaccharide deacetylase domain protein [uncultured Paludibacter sp.]